MDSKQLDKYLERIGFTDNPEPTLQSLTRLQKSHLLTVPFENLDIHLGVPIDINCAQIFTKVISQNRGGFCYELNSLFADLLRSIGFDITHLAAKVYAAPGGYSLPYSHLTLCAHIDNESFITDVGFGEFSFAPLKLLSGNKQHDQRGIFAVDQDDNNQWVVSKQTDEQFVPEYAFDLRHRELNEFNDMCHYHQTSPDSPFTQKRLISRPTEDGRITITKNTLIIKTHGQSQETTLSCEADFKAALQKYFEIDLLA